jgi:hypothetical protein
MDFQHERWTAPWGARALSQHGELGEVNAA